MNSETMQLDKIGLFYGSDTGNTETIAHLIATYWKGDPLIVHDIYDVSIDEIIKFDRIIFGLSTWHDGQIVSGFDEIIDELRSTDFSGKKVALFGLGDQFGYGEYFLDAMGILAGILLDNGAELIGEWPTKGYDYEASKADRGDGYFYGLGIDEDNQDYLTEKRIHEWILLIKDNVCPSECRT